MAMTATQKTLTVYTLLALAVLLPLLMPGHVLTLDMVFTPRIPMPDTVTSSYLFRTFLHVLNSALPSQIIEKLLLFTILVVSGYAMHKFILFLKINKPLGSAYLAGFFYMVNPYTYSRFMTGQYSVLLGYALLPLFCITLLRLLRTPTTIHASKLAGWTILISIVSIHTLGLAIILAFAGLGIELWRQRSPKYRMHLVKAAGLGVLIFVIASCYWLVPLALGKGSTASTIQSFGAGDSAAFETVGSNPVIKIANVIRLQGFWAEDRGLFLLPQGQVPAWGLIAIGMWILVFIGGRQLWHSQHRAVVAFLGISALVGLLIAIGLICLPGFREPHKFVGLVALMYAVFISQGMGRLVGSLKGNGAYVGMACCFVLVVALTPTMFWGFGGQLQARHYPDSWAVINRKLSEDTDSFQTLFLPWHLYMHYGFAGRIIANPAQQYFDKPVLVSNDPEFAGASKTSDDAIKDRLGHDILPKAPDRADLGAQLAGLRVKYIIFAKESDAPDYGYLDHQKDLELIQETDELKLYRNKAWKD